MSGMEITVCARVWNKNIIYKYIYIFYCIINNLLYRGNYYSMHVRNIRVQESKSPTR